MQRTKKCKKCSVVKPIEEFHKHKMMRDGHLNICKACKLPYISKWQKENRGKKLATCARWRDKHREQHNAIGNRWRKENPGASNAIVQARRARLLRATPKWSNKFFVDEIYRLGALRTKVTGIEWEVDHIIPLRNPLVCGLHWEGNMQVIPAEHNNRKGNRLLGCYTGEHA